MATCAACRREMMAAPSCTLAAITVDGVDYVRVRYGSEVAHNRDHEAYVCDPAPTCRDCGVGLEGLHHPLCCVEECPAGHGQAIGCDHFREAVTIP